MTRKTAALAGWTMIDGAAGAGWNDGTAWIA